MSADAINTKAANIKATGAAGDQASNKAGVVAGRLFRRAFAAAFLLAAACTNVEMPDTSQSSLTGPPDIDLSQYERTFTEDFNRLDASGRRCDTRWIAHTPWGGDFGYARFADPSRGFPFIAHRGVLRIEARKEPDGKWLSGLLAARNTCGEGFSQKYGYFEARAMLPEGDGFWPAFWLMARDSEEYSAEIDVFEHHAGIEPERFSSTLHVHPKAEGVRRLQKGNLHEVPEGFLSKRFNLYGVDITEENIVIYFNRQEIWRAETPPEMNAAFFPLINLAMDEGYTTDETPSPAFMYVDYVHAYQRKTPQ